MIVFASVVFIEPSSLPSLHALTGIKDNNSVPWTIVGILTLLTLLPAICSLHYADGAAAGGVSLPPPGAWERRRRRATRR